MSLFSMLQPWFSS